MRVRQSISNVLKNLLVNDDYIIDELHISYCRNVCGSRCAGDQIVVYGCSRTRRSLGAAQLSRSRATQASDPLVQRQRHVHGAIQPRRQNQQVCHGIYSQQALYIVIL